MGGIEGLIRRNWVGGTGSEASSVLSAWGVPECQNQKCSPRSAPPECPTSIPASTARPLTLPPPLPPSQNRSLIYGEVEFTSFSTILLTLLHLTPPGGTFYDIGSGSGRAVMAARIIGDFDTCVGIEIMEGLATLADGITFVPSSKRNLQNVQLKHRYTPLDRNLFGHLPPNLSPGGDTQRRCSLREEGVEGFNVHRSYSSPPPLLQPCPLTPPSPFFCHLPHPPPPSLSTSQHPPASTSTALFLLAPLLFNLLRSSVTDPNDPT